MSDPRSFIKGVPPGFEIKCIQVSELVSIEGTGLLFLHPNDFERIEKSFKEKEDKS